MEVTDPRLAAIAAGAAVIGSERLRKVVGRGFGYAAAGVISVGTPVISAGREIVVEAREVASGNSSDKARRSPSK